MSLLEGMSRPELEAALKAAQAAYVKLASGAAVVSLSYAQGDGSKSLSNRITSPNECARLIQQIKRALGMRSGTRLRRLTYL